MPERPGSGPRSRPSSLTGRADHRAGAAPASGPRLRQCHPDARACGRLAGHTRRARGRARGSARLVLVGVPLLDVAGDRDTGTCRRGDHRSAVPRPATGARGWSAGLACHPLRRRRVRHVRGSTGCRHLAGHRPGRRRRSRARGAGGHDRPCRGGSAEPSEPFGGRGDVRRGDPDGGRVGGHRDQPGPCPVAGHQQRGSARSVTVGRGARDPRPAPGRLRRGVARVADGLGWHVLRTSCSEPAEQPVVIDHAGRRGRRDGGDHRDQPDPRPSACAVGGRVSPILVGLAAAAAADRFGAESSSIVGCTGGRPEARWRAHRCRPEMAISADIPMPATFVIDDASQNAFATGRDPKHASIAVTRGLLDQMDREQLQGVVAHELGHVRNLDTRYALYLAVLVGLVALVTDGFLQLVIEGWKQGVFFGKSDDKAPSRPSRWACSCRSLPADRCRRSYASSRRCSRRSSRRRSSRRREFLADATSVEFTRNPQALERALASLASDHDMLDGANRGTQHLWFRNPVNSAAIAVPASLDPSVARGADRSTPRAPGPRSARPRSSGGRRDGDLRPRLGRVRPVVDLSRDRPVGSPGYRAGTSRPGRRPWPRA